MVTVWNQLLEIDFSSCLVGDSSPHPVGGCLCFCPGFSFPSQSAVLCNMLCSYVNRNEHATWAMIFGMSIRQFLQVRDLGVWDLKSNNWSLVTFNILLPPATCFPPFTQNYCLFIVMYSLNPLPEVTSFVPRVLNGNMCLFPLHRSVH